jgi:hypothetical protein
MNDDVVLVDVTVKTDLPDSMKYELIEGVPTAVGIYRFYLRDEEVPGSGVFEKVDTISLESVNGSCFCGKKLIDKTKLISKTNETLCIGYPAVNFIDGKACVEINQSKKEENITVHYWKTLIGIAGQLNAMTMQSEEGITFTTTFDEPVLTEVKGYDVIAIPDCGYTERIGEPMLPVKVFAVLLPPKTDIDSVEVSPVATAPLVGTYTIYPVQPPAIAQNYTEFVEPNETVYSAASPYPGEIYEDAGVGSLRGYRLARIRLYPIQYTPATGGLTFHKTIHVEIKTVPTPEAEVEFKSSIVALSGSNPELDRWIGSNTVNPEMVQSYKEELPITSAGGLVIASEERYDYLIITRNTFLPHITALKNKKAAAGLKVKVETVDDIVNKYPGANVPDKIRNCIKNYYALSGVKWVVLIGDTDSDDIDDNNPSETGMQMEMGDMVRAVLFRE